MSADSLDNLFKDPIARNLVSTMCDAIFGEDASSDDVWDIFKPLFENEKKEEKVTEKKENKIKENKNEDIKKEKKEEKKTNTEPKNRPPKKPKIVYDTMPEPQKVIFSCPVTAVLWTDGTKTTVRCQPEDTYDKEKGLALCFMKRYYGNNGSYNEILREWCKDVRQGMG